MQRNFAAGLRHCSELNGTNFYFEQRDRVLNLQDYRRSLDNLAAQGAYNPETRHPWNKADAEARWAHQQQGDEKRHAGHDRQHQSDNDQTGLEHAPNLSGCAGLQRRKGPLLDTGCREQLVEHGHAVQVRY